MRHISTILLLAMFSVGAVSVETGCKHGPVNPPVDEADANNPTARFQHGVSVLQNPDKKTGLVDYGGAYADFDTAAGLFDQKNDKPQAAKAHFNAGWVAEVLNKPDDAEIQYKAAYAADPTYEKALFSLSRILTQEEKFGEAVELYQGYVAAHPDNLDIRNNLVSALAAAGSYDAAAEEAQQILMKDPKNAAVYRSLSAMYYKQGNYGMSQLCGEKSLQLNEGDAGTYNNLGVTHLLQNDPAAAIEQFKTATKLDGDNYEANMNLGLVALNSGDYGLALECLQKAVTANPASIDAKLSLAVALRGTKDYDKAASLYDEVIKADPQNEMAYFNAATLHMNYTKDYARALKYLQAYVDAKQGTIGPSHPVFAKMDEVKAAQEAEKERAAKIAAEEQAKKEREERALATIKDLETIVTAMKAKVGACPADVQEEVNMMLEQATQVVTDKDTGMATDVKSMLTDYYGPMVDACAGAAPAPAPETPPGDGTTPSGGTPPGDAPAPG